MLRRLKKNFKIFKHRLRKEKRFKGIYKNKIKYLEVPQDRSKMKIKEALNKVINLALKLMKTIQ